MSKENTGAAVCRALSSALHPVAPTVTGVAAVVDEPLSSWSRASHGKACPSVAKLQAWLQAADAKGHTIDVVFRADGVEARLTKSQ